MLVLIHIIVRHLPCDVICAGLLLWMKVTAKTCRLQGRSHMPLSMLVSAVHEHSASNADGSACMTAKAGVAETPGPQQQQYITNYWCYDRLSDQTTVI